MDKRRRRLLILLGTVAIIILVVGIGVAHTYTVRNRVSQYLYDMNYDGLGAEAKARVDSLCMPGIQQWLVKWVVMPVGLFAILTAALVVSRVISNRIKPPSGPS